MKRFYTILLSAAAIAALAACQGLNEIPQFEETESFACFPKASVMVDENGGQVVIPVDIASIQPVKTAVSYEIVDGTAKKGVDYTDTNASAVLTFDGTTRSQNIVINVVNREGEYTGDLDFTINLISATGLKLSNERSCKVSIGDLDHPLASILGEYTGAATSYWDGAVSWTMTLLKDPTDVTVVWIDGITNEFLGTANRFYGNVFYNEDETIGGFTCPAGQTVYYPGRTDYVIRLHAGNAEAMNINDDGSMTWYLNGNSFAMDPNDANNTIGFYIYGPNDPTAGYGWWNFYTVAPSYTKK